MSVRGYVNMVWVLEEARGAGPPEAEVTGACEPSSVGAGNPA